MFTNLKEWILRNEKKIFVGIFIVLIATASFALGYMTAKENTRAPIIIEKTQ